MNRKLIGCILFVFLSGFIGSSHAEINISKFATFMSLLFTPDAIHLNDKEITAYEETIKDHPIKCTVEVKEKGTLYVSLANDDKRHVFAKGSDGSILDETQILELGKGFMEIKERIEKKNEASVLTEVDEPKESSTPHQSDDEDNDKDKDKDS